MIAKTTLPPLKLEADSHSQAVTGSESRPRLEGSLIIHPIGEDEAHPGPRWNGGLETSGGHDHVPVPRVPFQHHDRSDPGRPGHRAAG